MIETGNWAHAFLLPYKNDTNEILISSPVVGIAHRIGEGWEAALPSNPTIYNQWLEEIPESILPLENKNILFINVPEMKVASAASVSGYYLPWPRDEYAYAARHDDLGSPEYKAIDFAITRDIVAAKSGIVVFRKDTSDTSCGDGSCSWQYANMVVINSGGEYHWYMHLAYDLFPITFKKVNQLKEVKS